ncbi:MAG: hypothetical protein KA338_21145 [Chloroflexi bacterium]|nr:hypothetical protein [Chloroflexota bacterium]
MPSKCITCLCLVLFLLACQGTTPLIPATQASSTTTTLVPQTLTPSPVIPTPEPVLTYATPTIAPSKTPTSTPIIPTFVSFAAATTTPSPSTFPLQSLGLSYNGHPLEVYKFGDGDTILIWVGGIHGGYEWNTIILAYTAIDYFQANPQKIPPNITLYIIPSANPDGQFLVTGKEERFTANDVSADTAPGRFNGRNVDLNRNWDCQWQAEGLWRNQPVSAGTDPFSEPETQLLRDFFLAQQPSLVIFWHSAVNGVFTAGCPDLYEPAWQLATVYGMASHYPVYERFSYYTITGDASDWLAIMGIPSFSVELTTHESIDWEQNLADILAILQYYAPPSMPPGFQPVGGTGFPPS